MKTIVIFLLVGFYFSACTQKDRSKNDYHKCFMFMESDLVTDTSGNLIIPQGMEGSIKKEWIVNGVFKYFDNELYLMYAIPEKDKWLNTSPFKKEDALFSETGYIKYEDLFPVKNCVSPVQRLRGVQGWVRYL